MRVHDPLIRPRMIAAMVCASFLFIYGCELATPSLRNMAPDYGFPTQDGFAGELNGGVSDGEGMGGNGPEGEEGNDWPEMNGYWRVEHFTTLRSELPVIMEEVETQVRATLIMEVTQDLDQLWFHHQICDVNMTNTPAYNQTIIPDSFVNALPLKTRRAQLLKVPDTEPSAYRLNVPVWHDLRSVILSDPSQDALPIRKDDPRVYDQDQDGIPGLTARLVGFPEGEVSLIQNSWDQWLGTVVLGESNLEKNRVASVEGEIVWDQSQAIIEASNDVLLIEVRRWVAEDPELHYFEMQRIDQLQCPPRRDQPRPSQ